MVSTTRNKCVVVSLLIMGLILMALPLSVFSQEGELLIDSDSIAVTSVTDTGSVYQHTYQIDKIDGDFVGDFVVGPGKQELSLSPGESIKTEIIVSNRTGKTSIFKLNVEDITGSQNGESSVVLLGDDRGPYTLKDYVSIPQMEFELKHNERAHIPVTVSLPATVEPGGWYGSIVVSTISKDADLNPAGGAAPSSAIISRIGSLLFVTSPGEIEREGALVSFDTIAHKKFYVEGPIEMGLVFENTGSIHLNPYGEIRITNMIGDEIGFVELDPWFALPKSLRTREVSWNRELLMGRYTAVASVNRGYNNDIDEISFTFWVIPWKLLTGVFIGLFIFFLAIRFVVTKFEFKRKV